jgi:hypothetical protein
MWANKFDDAEYHKQIVNRLIEPFGMMKVVCSATEFDNFFWLRCHKDAQPEIKELANMMYLAKKESVPLTLNNGEYHLPYVTSDILKECEKYKDASNNDSLRIALKVSASCCAQVSYRLNDTSIEKALKIYDKLVTSQPVHASPFEHQARPISDEDIKLFKTSANDTPITHTCKKCSYWSGNFKGWIQHRHEIPNNTCWKYEP